MAIGRLGERALRQRNQPYKMSNAMTTMVTIGVIVWNLTVWPADGLMTEGRSRPPTSMLNVEIRQDLEVPQNEAYQQYRCYQSTHGQTILV
jgi:hypothetical protein